MELSNSIKPRTYNFIPFRFLVAAVLPSMESHNFFTHSSPPPPTPLANHPVSRGSPSNRGKSRDGPEAVVRSRVTSGGRVLRPRPDVERPEANIIPVGASCSRRSPRNATMRRLYAFHVHSPTVPGNGSRGALENSPRDPRPSWKARLRRQRRGRRGRLFFKFPGTDRKIVGALLPFVGTSTRILLAKRFTGVRRLPGRFLPRIARSSSLLAPLTVDSFGFCVTRDRDGMPLMTATQPDLDRFRLPFITLSLPSPLPGWLGDEAHASFRVASTRRRSFLFRPLAGFVRTVRLWSL